MILSVEEYERRAETIDLIENMSIYDEIKDRLHTNKKLLDGNDVFKKHGLSLDV